MAATSYQQFLEKRIELMEALIKILGSDIEKHKEIERIQIEMINLWKNKPGESSIARIARLINPDLLDHTINVLKRAERYYNHSSTPNEQTLLMDMMNLVVSLETIRNAR